MALGLPTTTSGGADFLPRIQFDARAGRFFRIDRSQSPSGDWVKTQKEIPVPTKLAIDFENIEVGWMAFTATGPDFRLAKIGQPIPPRPDTLDDKGKPLFKQGFRVRVYTKGLGVREWSHSARCVIEQVDAAHSAWEAGKAANPGKIPVVAINRTFPVQTGQSTNYAPEMVIDQWIDRPEGMTAEAAPAPAQTQQPAPAPAPAQHVAPPPAAMQPAPAPAQAGEYF